MAARLEAIARYDAAASQVLAPTADPAEIARQLDKLAATAGLAPADDQARRIERIHEVLNAALADRIVTDDEFDHYGRLLTSFGVPLDAFASTISSRQHAQLHTSWANRGQIEPITNSTLLRRLGESVYLDLQASLLKEVTDKEWQSASTGVSVRVMRGVYVRRGESRGHSVVVGSHLETADAGLLSVTNTRVAFRGQRQTIEMPIPKIIDMRVFDDGITFHVSSKARSPQFQLEPGWGEAVAATINHFSPG